MLDTSLLGIPSESIERSPDGPCTWSPVSLWSLTQTALRVVKSVCYNARVTKINTRWRTYVMVLYNATFMMDVASHVRAVAIAGIKCWLRAAMQRCRPLAPEG
jgi:hypothetical protein